MIVVKKGDVEVIRGESIVIVKYNATMVIFRAGQKEPEGIKALPEHVQNIVRSVVEYVEPVSEDEAAEKS